MCQFKQFFVAGWPQIFYKRTTKGKKRPNIYSPIWWNKFTVINFPQRGNISSNIQIKFKGDALIRFLRHLISLFLYLNYNNKHSRWNYEISKSIKQTKFTQCKINTIYGSIFQQAKAIWTHELFKAHKLTRKRG